MKWQIEYSREADEFIERENIRTQVRQQLKNFIRKLRGEDINVNVKQLKGSWKGYIRIKKGKIRIIFWVEYKTRSIFIERVDFCGKVYK